MNKFHSHTHRSAVVSIHSPKKQMLLMLVICFIFYSFAPVKISKAEGSQVGVQIDYYNELVYLTAGTGNSSKFYMSTDDKTWELLDTTVIDISSLLASKPVTVYFKGNKDLKTPVTLSAEDSTLKVSYKITNGVGSIEFSNTSIPIEYRNGVNGAWKTAPNPMTTAIYEVRGTTLYFRTAAAPTRRAGKIISIKISKRPTAPSVKLDGSKLSITGLKVGQIQYRVNNDTAWTTFSSPDQRANSLDLRSILAVTSSAITLIPSGLVELRTVGSDKKLNSAVKVIEISQQPVVPDQITLTGTTLSIVDSNAKRYYEYTTVSAGSALNLNTARWTSVTSRNAVVLRKVSIGDKIYVRLKSTTDAAKQIILASSCKEFTVTTITPASSH